MTPVTAARTVGLAASVLVALLTILPGGGATTGVFADEVADDRGQDKKPTFTKLDGLVALHKVPLADFQAGATVPLGNGAHRFDNVPEYLQGRRFTRRGGYQGILKFRVEKAQRVYLAVYGANWGGGGNSSGGWRKELVTRERLKRQGWKEAGRLVGEHTLLDGQMLAWIVFTRNCKAGETFAIRTHKYQAPILFSAKKRSKIVTQIKSPKDRCTLRDAYPARKATDATKPKPKTAQDNPQASHDNAAAAFKKLGGRVTFDTKSPDRPATGVRLFGPRFTDAHLVHLKGLTSLQTLYLTNTRVTDAGLAHLKALKSLQVLRLNGTKVTDAGLAHVNGLTNLKTLGLGYKITDDGLAHLKALTKLQTLYLTNTQVTDAGLAHLKALKSLRVLYLHGARVTDAGLVHLNRLKSLETLNLYTQVTDAGLANLKGLKRLQVLDLNGTQVTDAGLVNLKGLKRLQTLHLTNTKVTGTGLQHLKVLTTLQGLYLTNTKVTDAGLLHVEGLTSLQTLGLHGTRVTDAGMEHLYHLMKLRTLYLTNTKVTGAGVKALRTALPKCHIGN